MGPHLERDLDDSLGPLTEMRNRARAAGGEEKKNVSCSASGRRSAGTPEGVAADSDSRVLRESLAYGSPRRCDHLGEWTARRVGSFPSLPHSRHQWSRCPWSSQTEQLSAGAEVWGLRVKAALWRVWIRQI